MRKLRFYPHTGNGRLIGLVGSRMCHLGYSPKCPAPATGDSLPWRQFFSIPWREIYIGVNERMVLRVRPTPARFPTNTLSTAEDSTTLHSVWCSRVTLTVLPVRPTLTWFPTNILYTPVGNTPLHSIPEGLKVILIIKIFLYDIHLIVRTFNHFHAAISLARITTRVVQHVTLSVPGTLNRLATGRHFCLYHPPREGMEY